MCVGRARHLQAQCRRHVDVGLQVQLKEAAVALLAGPAAVRLLDEQRGVLRQLIEIQLLKVWGMWARGDGGVRCGREKERGRKGIRSGRVMDEKG